MPSTDHDAGATLRIDARHNGPRTSGNGGWVAGALALRLARRLAAPVASVALRAPVPLDRPLPLRWQPDGSLALCDGDSVVAEAAALGPDSLADLALPIAPADDVAEAAGLAARLRHQQRGLGDAYAHCFVCGFARPDGLGVIVGPVGGADDGSGLMATTWVPPAALAGPDGTVSVEATWAALDCPAGMAWSQRLGRSAPIMTVRMTACVDQPLLPGQRYRVLAWPLDRDGRKLHAGTAIVDAAGAVRARSRQLWLLPRDPV